MEKKRPRSKKKNALKPTVNQLSSDLVALQKKFNEAPDRFLEVIIKDEIQTLDLAGRWTVITRRLKDADYSEEAIEKIKPMNDHFVDLYLQIERLKVTINKEGKGGVNRTQPVLREQGNYILQQSGEFRSVKSIYNELTKKMGYKISIPTLRSYITENKSIIDKFREDYKAELFTSSIAVDSGRLKFWEEAFEFYYDRWKAYGKIADFNACAKIITEVRVEIKGDMVVTVNGKISIDHSLEANKSLNHKLGELSINLINIGLAAQKANINPLPLFAQLANSHYNEWNGISDKPLNLKDKDQLSHVSNFIKNYDWDAIQKKNEVPYNMGNIEDAHVIDDEEEEQIINANKQKLLDLLRNKSL